MPLVIDLQLHLDVLCLDPGQGRLDPEVVHLDQPEGDTHVHHWGREVFPGPLPGDILQTGAGGVPRPHPDTTETEGPRAIDITQGHHLLLDTETATDQVDMMTAIAPRPDATMKGKHLLCVPYHQAAVVVTKEVESLECQT